MYNTEKQLKTEPSYRISGANNQWAALSVGVRGGDHTINDRGVMQKCIDLL